MPQKTTAFFPLTSILLPFLSKIPFIVILTSIHSISLDFSCVFSPLSMQTIMLHLFRARFVSLSIPAGMYSPLSNGLSLSTTQISKSFFILLLWSASSKIIYLDFIPEASSMAASRFFEAITLTLTFFAIIYGSSLTSGGFLKMFPFKDTRCTCLSLIG